uniref:Cation efflux protein cytoplasmic domain-containing protein n=1 Tax=Alexandrium monilatum TaxID=311494 RepID=A0A7S4VRT5_9DINO
MARAAPSGRRGVIMNCGNTVRCHGRGLFRQCSPASVNAGTNCRRLLVGRQAKECWERGRVFSTASPLEEAAPAPEPRERRLALRVTWWGAGTNVSLAAMKWIAGSLTGSTALVADAAHSLSDLLSDIITLFVVDVARVPPDPAHPYGHGRFEAVGSLSVAAVLVATAGGVGWASISVVAGWWRTGAVECALAESGYGGLAVAACVVSLLSKEALYHATIRVGRTVDSQTLVANAWHHRSDALSSVAALVGVGGSMVGMPLLDPAAGLLVSALVAKAGVEIGWEAVAEVTEKAEPGEEVREAVRAIARATAGVVSIDRLRTRKMGPFSLVDLCIEVDPEISVSAAYQVGEHLRHEIHRSQPNVSEVLVTVVPFQRGTVALMRPHTEVEREVRALLASVPGIRGVSHVIAHYVPGDGIRLKVDIVCDSSITVRDACGIAGEARSVLEGLHGISSVDVDLELDA